MSFLFCDELSFFGLSSCLVSFRTWRLNRSQTKTVIIWMLMLTYSSSSAIETLFYMYGNKCLIFKTSNNQSWSCAQNLLYPNVGTRMTRRCALVESSLFFQHRAQSLLKHFPSKAFSTSSEWKYQKNKQQRCVCDLFTKITSHKDNRRKLLDNFTLFITKISIIFFLSFIKNSKKCSYKKKFFVLFYWRFFLK